MNVLGEYESGGCLHDIFKAQAQRTPRQIAVVFEGNSITYEELDKKTDLLAAKLISLGAKTDVPVGIYMEKCIEYVISYIAILKAGAPYMPLDVTYPSHLLLDIFDDAKPACILTSKQWGPRITEIADGKETIFTLSDAWPEKVSRSEREKAQPARAKLDDLAYVCYSSGTTGKPKGIMCPHRGAVFSYTWRHLAYPFEEGERVACNVFFTWEMLRPLLKGVTMYIIPDNVIYDPALLVQFMQTNEITRVLFTPSLLETVLDTEGINVDSLKSLRIVWFCGEVVTMSLLGRCMKSLPWVQFLNLYSISECHDVAAADLSSFWTSKVIKGNSVGMEKKKFAPVGTVLPGVCISVRNENLEEQPPGVPGEIYVGGPTLARQYLNRPEINKKRFLNIQQGNETIRLYKTGDWGLVLSNRDLEICGRCDSMVKIRGFSIEIQAVENAILQNSKVNACVVLAVGEEGTDKQLVAYVVPTQEITAKVLRSDLKQRLPNYMIPAHILFLKHIPMLAATGKLDKKALPSITSSSEGAGGGFQANERPPTETEKVMRKLWSEILQFQVSDMEESFFDLGGHSLLAARLIGKIREVFDAEIDVKTLFAKPTIAELSELIDSRTADTTSLVVEREVDLKKEVLLNAVPEVNLDIQLRAFWRSVNYGHRWRRGRVLLTGATGFIGAYILRDLLTLTKTNIYCLVKKSKDHQGIERLRKTMEFYEFFNDDNFRESFEDRVHAIHGDVALFELGMEEEDYMHLTHEVDFVIHCAAYVNLIYPYDALKGANVYGTKNVLLFCSVGKVKALHYISTNAVFPIDESECKEDTSEAMWDRLDNGYSRSKWVAEQLVLSALRNGLPTIIYRLGNAGGDRVNAGWNQSDFNLLILQACCMAKVWPTMTWSVEMTPVDFISKSVVTFSQNFKIAKHKIFHLINANRISSEKLCDILIEEGYELTKVPFEEWCDKVASMDEPHLREGQPSVKQMLRTVTESRDSSLFFNDATFDQSVFTEVARSVMDEEYPKIDSLLIKTYIRNLSRRRILVRPQKEAKLPLQSKVAVITGASSGIGRAVAEQLAMVGAKVCLCARRDDKLFEVQDGIVRSGGFAKVYKLDVTNRQQFIDVAKNIQDECGQIDILMNNAGLMYYTHIHNFMQDDWDRMVNVNCIGITNSLAAVLPGMLERKTGHIINTSSDAGRRGFPGLAVYSGTKFFVEGLSQALRHEVKDKGIRVTCIQPGDVKTELLTHTNDHDAKAAYDGSESCRILDPEDVGKAVLYAVSQPEHVGVNEILIEPRENPI